MAQTKAQKKAEQNESLEYLQEWKDDILEPSSLLEFRTEYGKGQTDYVSVHLYYQKNGIGQKADITFRVGKACGYSFRRTPYKAQLALGGGGYSKSYDVALRLFSVLGITKDNGLDQVNWEYR